MSGSPASLRQGVSRSAAQTQLVTPATVLGMQLSSLGELAASLPPNTTMGRLERTRVPVRSAPRRLVSMLSTWKGSSVTE